MAFDPDFGKGGFARHLFRLRFRDLKLSQRAFAERFGLSYSVVRDAEQGAKPTRALRVIGAASACDPGLIETAARMATRPCGCGEGDAYQCCAPWELPGNGNYPALTRARDGGKIDKVTGECRDNARTRGGREGDHG